MSSLVVQVDSVREAIETEAIGERCKVGSEPPTQWVVAARQSRVVEVQGRRGVEMVGHGGQRCGAIAEVGGVLMVGDESRHSLDEVKHVGGGERG